MCGPACLKMVLEFLGEEHSERSLGKLAGTTKKDGTPGEGLVKAAKKLGFRAKIKDHATPADVRKYVTGKKIPVIIDWFYQDCGHYSVVVGADKTHLQYIDPVDGKIHAMSWKHFMTIWFDFNGPYPRREKDMILQRIIVIER